MNAAGKTASLPGSEGWFTSAIVRRDHRESAAQACPTVRSEASEVPEWLESGQLMFTKSIRRRRHPDPFMDTHPKSLRQVPLI